jgi:hypothetical protein
MWEISTRIDPLANLSLNKMEEIGLVDVEPYNIFPAWRNEGTSKERVAKRLGIFWILHFDRLH